MRKFAGLFIMILSLRGSFAVDAGPVPGPPTINARAHVLMDFHSGQIIAAQNMQEQMEPASLTKIMTIYSVAYELKSGSITLDDEVLISENAWRMDGSRMFVEVGTRVRVEDLMKGDIVQSGNDASVALGEHVSGSEEVFAHLMNKHAEALGLTGTHYVNSSGLPHPDHVTTAHDVALLSAALIREFPDIYAWFSIREFTYNNITQRNRNRLLSWSNDVDGIKTGYTETAGFCLAASAIRNEQRLIAVVMGAESDKVRTNDTKALLEYGFRYYETHRLYGAGEPVTQVKVWKGEREALDVGLKDPLYVTVPRGSYDRLDASMNLDARVVAPIDVGANIGFLEIKLGSNELAKRPLIALQAVSEGSFMNRTIDQIQMMFE
jgi:D-alanyl-D-alanine carboxypeptidase (penicillin-binding protein 5/6)